MRRHSFFQSSELQLQLFVFLCFLTVFAIGARVGEGTLGAHRDEWLCPLEHGFHAIDIVGDGGLFFGAFLEEVDEIELPISAVEHQVEMGERQIVRDDVALDGNIFDKDLFHDAGMLHFVDGDFTVWFFV